MPEIRPKPLYRADRKNFARLLGLDVLPDACVQAIAWLIAVHKAACNRTKVIGKNGKPRSIGHTPAKWEAELRRIENRMHRGHDGLEVTRTITDPLFDVDIETYERLAQIVADPDAPLDRKLAEIEVRRRELEALPEVDALHGLRVVLVAFAVVCVWYLFAVRRDDTVRQWKFILAILEAAGEGTKGLREHPGRLKRDVGRLMQLTASRP